MQVAKGALISGIRREFPGIPGNPPLQKFPAGIPGNF